MVEAFVSAESLSIGYNEPLLEDASFEIKPGDVIALLGPSGIGKTTLLRTIFGAVEPISGSIVSKLNNRGDLGFIPQRLGLIGNLSVQTNVLNGVRVRKKWYQSFFAVFDKKSITKVDECINQLGLGGHEKQLVRTLSGGQQRRVATARTLAQEPKLILADEFLGELDEDNVELVLDSIQKMIQSNKSAILMVEHHEDIALKVANKIWRIEGKSLVEENAGEAFQGGY